MDVEGIHKIFKLQTSYYTWFQNKDNLENVNGFCCNIITDCYQTHILRNYLSKEYGYLRFFYVFYVTIKNWLLVFG